MDLGSCTAPAEQAKQISRGKEYQLVQVTYPTLHYVGFETCKSCHLALDRAWHPGPQCLRSYLKHAYSTASEFSVK